MGEISYIFKTDNVPAQHFHVAITTPLWLFNGAQKLIDFQIAAKTGTALGNSSATFPHPHTQTKRSPVTAGRKAVRCFVIICECRKYVSQE